VAILFDIDGTLISTGGAGARSWKMAFDALYGIPADIGAFTDSGMTDPEVGRRTFVKVIGREPTIAEMARVMQKRLAYLPQCVAESEGYKVLRGVQRLLPLLAERRYLLGLTTGGVEAAARIKLERARLNGFFSFGGYGSDSPDRTELTKCAVARAGDHYGEGFQAGLCLVVGDTPLDVESALDAGAVPVGVASGHYSVNELREAGADHVLGSLEEDLPL
jgi:phosphoglycolate phosphatase-like HAD superfamily hydrolase